MTESETKVFLADVMAVGGKPLKDMVEAVNHVKAYDFMFSSILCVFQHKQVVVKEFTNSFTLSFILCVLLKNTLHLYKKVKGIFVVWLFIG